jgi:O-antigen/teichoic acid export membrane protein
LGFKQLKELSFIGGSDIIGSSVGAIFWFIIASQVSPEEYGELFYFIGIAATVAAIALVGGQNTVTVYSSKNLNIESTLYFISLILGIISSFVIIIIFYKIDIVFLLFGYIINTLAIGELLGKKLFSKYSKYVLIQKFLTVGLGLLAFVFFGIEGIIPALSITYIFFTIIIFKQFKETKIDFSLLKNRTKFILNNYVIGILTKLNSHLNKFFIVPLLGFGILGNFSLALQIVNIGLIFTMIIFKYTLSYDAQGKDNKKLKKFTLVVSVMFAIVGSLVSPYIIPSLFPEYIEVIDVIQIISFSLIPMTLVKIFSSKLLGQEKTKQIVYSKIVSMATFIVGILLLAPEYGIFGLAISYMLSTIFEAVCLIPYSQKLLSKE